MEVRNADDSSIVPYERKRRRKDFGFTKDPVAAEITLSRAGVISLQKPLMPYIPPVLINLLEGISKLSAKEGIPASDICLTLLRGGLDRRARLDDQAGELHTSRRTFGRSTSHGS